MPQAQTLNTIKTYPIGLDHRVTDIEKALSSDEAIMVVESPNADQTIVGGRLIMSALATPAAPTVTPTGGSATSYSYAVVALLGTGTTAASPAGSTTTGVATLTALAFNTVTWAAITGATGYNIYRTVGGATQGKIATNVTALTLVDPGLVGDASTAPSINSTGTINAVMQENLAIAAANGAIATYGRTLITKSTAAVLTLALPIAGAPSAGGQDGTRCDVTDTTGHAHTVTTPANGIASTGVTGGAHIITFGGTANSTVGLIAVGGVWVPTGLAGASIS